MKLSNKNITLQKIVGLKKWDSVTTGLREECIVFNVCIRKRRFKLHRSNIEYFGDFCIFVNGSVWV